MEFGDYFIVACVMFYSFIFLYAYSSIKWKLMLMIDYNKPGIDFLQLYHGFHENISLKIDKLHNQIRRIRYGPDLNLSNAVNRSQSPTFSEDLLLQMDEISSVFNDLPLHYHSNELIDLLNSLDSAVTLTPVYRSSIVDKIFLWMGYERVSYRARERMDTKRIVKRARSELLRLIAVIDTLPKGLYDSITDHRRNVAAVDNKWTQTTANIGRQEQQKRIIKPENIPLFVRKAYPTTALASDDSVKATMYCLNRMTWPTKVLETLENNLSRPPSPELDSIYDY